MEKNPTDLGHQKSTPRSHGSSEEGLLTAACPQNRLPFLKNIAKHLYLPRPYQSEFTCLNEPAYKKNFKIKLSY
jgi:hypothetical protein